MLLVAHMALNSLSAAAAPLEAVRAMLLKARMNHGTASSTSIAAEELCSSSLEAAGGRAQAAAAAGGKLWLSPKRSRSISRGGWKHAEKHAVGQPKLAFQFPSCLQ